MERKYEIEIKGTSPLLMHRMVDSVLNDQKTKTGEPIKDDVEAALYRLPNGTIYLPAEHVLKALIEAGKNFQIKGRGKKNYSQLVAACVQIDPFAIPVKPDAYVADERSVVIPATRGRQMRRRPRFDEWGLIFDLTIIEDQLPEPVLKDCIDWAGKFNGLGDYRPQKKGSFGKFLVSRFSRKK